MFQEVRMMQQRCWNTPSGNIVYHISHSKPGAPWLVFLPGLSADHSLFDKQIEYFSAAFNCFVWDAPAHGLSRPFSLSFSMRDLAAWLHGIIQREGIDAPLLIGQSLGGYIAQVYMDMYPGEVRGFVSIDSCPMSRKYYSWWELALLKRTKWMYLSIPWSILVPWGIYGTAATAYGRELMKRSWSVYGKVEFCALADHGYRILAQAIEEKAEYPIACPVLLLCGEKDMAGSAKRYNRQWAKQDGHRLVWIKGAGHNANTDAPDTVNRLIEAFAHQIPGRSV